MFFKILNMQNIILRFALILVFFNSYSQNTPIESTFVEDENGKIITSNEEKRIFFTKFHLKKAIERLLV